MKESRSAVDIKISTQPKSRNLRTDPNDPFIQSSTDRTTPYEQNSKYISFKPTNFDYYSNVVKHFFETDDDINKLTTAQVTQNEKSNLTVLQKKSHLNSNFSKLNNLKNKFVRPNEIVRKADYKFDLSSKIKTIYKKKGAVTGAIFVV